MKPLPPPGPPARLWVAAGTLVIVVGLVTVMQGFMQTRIHQHIERFNVYPQTEKLTGVALPTEAFVNPAMLPVYGSSELTQPEGNRADEFFGAHPTGFGAFLMGNPGETSLIVATRLASTGSEARGKKAVVFLSPGWFVAPELDHRGFGVNFSPLQGGIFAFESRLSADLKRDLARRLLDYPETIGQSPLLQTRLSALSGRAPGGAEWVAPLGEALNRLQREMDFFWAGYWWAEHRSTAQTAGGAVAPIDWNQRLQQADAKYARQPALTSYSTGPRTGFDDNLQKGFVDPRHPESSPDENFARACGGSKEWGDLALLLRTAREMKIRLLLICQPCNAKFNRLQGLTEHSNALFYDRLRDTVTPYKVKLVTFPDEERDPRFYRDCVHPSAKAWIAYDATLDAFFHEPVAGDL